MVELAELRRLAELGAAAIDLQIARVRWIEGQESYAEVNAARRRFSMLVGQVAHDYLAGMDRRAEQLPRPLALWDPLSSGTPDAVTLQQALRSLAGVH